MDKKTLLKLQITATKIRKNIVEQVFSANSGHPGGSLSSAEVFTALYFNEMNIDPTNPKKSDRDRFVLSKGHCAPGLYAALAERGYFPVSDLKGFRDINSYLQGHPSMKDVPGVDMSTGSLGQGISAAVGMAISGKLYNEDYRVYSLLGDGELEEGQVWEAMMSAAHYKLDNLMAFVDNNGLQIDGKISDVMNPDNIESKFKAFNWNVIVLEDGNDMAAVIETFEQAKACKGKPTMVILHTIKGKGVSYMEDDYGWHGKAPNQEERDLAIKELDEKLVELEGAQHG
ncbi:MAG: transketolase [Clostridiales bacterium]|nr:transketolase [Clostridiales bacterium]